MPRMEDIYKETVIPQLNEQFGYTSAMQVPKISKITLNMGIGEAVGDKKIIEHAVADLKLISGQQPIVRVARKSIANFKIRDGWPIGAKVTLRRARMYEFLDRLISIALPRVRDFRGISTKSFDGRGNYTLGLQEHLVFPEIDYAKVDKMKGMNVTIVTTAASDPEALSLLRSMGMPFRD
ncbi:MAG: 50S ribosomal protein L5 [Gammaproteobacteria bacterium]|nr:50S ribosomal protein L5 [Gammaproteobacteria bacterium]